MKRFFLFATLAVGLSRSALTQPRPFGTLQEQADLQQQWLERRLTTVLPGLMREYGIDMWVLPMREYTEDPIPSMWFSAEPQVTRPVPEWGGQPVRMAQEEDSIVGADGKPRWALKRQSALHLVR